MVTLLSGLFVMRKLAVQVMEFRITAEIFQICLIIYLNNLLSCLHYLYNYLIIMIFIIMIR